MVITGGDMDVRAMATDSNDAYPLNGSFSYTTGHKTGLLEECMNLK
jgi:hypothetical protein